MERKQIGQIYTIYIYIYTISYHHDRFVSNFCKCGSYIHVRSTFTCIFTSISNHLLQLARSKIKNVFTQGCWASTRSKRTCQPMRNFVILCQETSSILTKVLKLKRRLTHIRFKQLKLTKRKSLPHSVKAYAIGML